MADIDPAFLQHILQNWLTQQRPAADPNVVAKYGQQIPSNTVPAGAPGASISGVRETFMPNERPAGFEGASQFGPPDLGLGIPRNPPGWMSTPGLEIAAGPHANNTWGGPASRERGSSGPWNPATVQMDPLEIPLGGQNQMAIDPVNVAVQGKQGGNHHTVQHTITLDPVFLKMLAQASASGD